MAELPPVEIGTRGTGGSLVKQEKEYFSRIKSYKPQVTNVSNAKSTNKERISSSSRLLPSMCSMVDVSSSDKGRPNGTSAFSFRPS